MNEVHLCDITKDLQSEPIRKGFGRGLQKAGELDERVVAALPTLPIQHR